MKNSLVIFALLAGALGGRAALPQPDLLAQIHFAGAQKISADANALAFTNEFCSAEALALRAQTADKLAAWLAGWLQKNSGGSVPGGAARLRPLFDDLQSAEWFLEARTAANGQPEVALAVKLADSRAQLWRMNLKPFFPAANFKTAGGWLIFDASPDAPRLGERLSQKISAPPAGWLAVDLNWPRLAQYFPPVKEFNLPETQFTVTAAAANFLINGKFFFADNLAPALEPWRMPTNTVHQPFVSFTAARGFAAWLRSQPVEFSPPPDQVFIWALQGIPFQTFAAVPVPDAAAALAQAYARLKPQVENAGPNGFMTPFTLELTNNEAALLGVPFIAPYLAAKTEAAGQFLLAGAFPNTPRSKPLPPELFARLAEKNLVYYHWEITAERMPQLLNLGQLTLVLTSHKQLDADAAAGKWLTKIAPTLGNTTTEVFRSGPAELAFTRKAPGGFTAVELFALACWLDAGNFPGCDLKLPPRPAKFKRAHPPSPGGPAAPGH